MTTAEFSAELDVIYENINKNGAPGLDGYEKSVILTHAENLLVKETLKADPSASQFPQLIEIFETTSPSLNTGFSWGVSFPNASTAGKGVILILNEIVIDSDFKSYTVIPINQLQFDKKQITPYKYPPRRGAWRIAGLNNTAVNVEIFGRPDIILATYKARYVRKPVPIIVSTLTGSDSIDGLTAITQCELDESLHIDIVKIAATLAESYYYDKYGTDGNK